MTITCHPFYLTKKIVGIGAIRPPHFGDNDLMITVLFFFPCLSVLEARLCVTSDNT